MVIYMVQIIDTGERYIKQTYIDSVWKDMTNAQCQVDRLNDEFERYYPENNHYAKMKPMKLQDYEVGRDSW